MRAVLLALALSCASAPPSRLASKSNRYDDLVALFADWRMFQQPRLVDGVPDYGAAAIRAQRQGLEEYRHSLAAIDPSGWPVPQQVDYHLLRAEMNGLDFDHRILQPWANNPAFYVTVVADESDQPAREGPFAFGTVGLWEWPFPLSAAKADELARRLSPIPGLLRQARENPTGNGRDLWKFGIRALEQQRELLADLRGKAQPHPGLAASAARAAGATDELIAWLTSQAPSKTGPSGVGIENYDWYLANVQLLPYTWAEEMTLVERELARAKSALAL